MTSLTDMPADIVEAAAEVYAGLHANNYDADCDDRERSEDRLAIAQAILLERQKGDKSADAGYLTGVSDAHALAKRKGFQDFADLLVEDINAKARRSGLPLMKVS